MALPLESMEAIKCLSTIMALTYFRLPHRWSQREYQKQLPRQPCEELESERQCQLKEIEDGLYRPALRPLVGLLHKRTPSPAYSDPVRRLIGTQIPELMNSLHHLVASGKVLYLGISDTPAWIVVKCNDYGMWQTQLLSVQWICYNRSLTARLFHHSEIPRPHTVFCVSRSLELCFPRF